MMDLITQWFGAPVVGWTIVIVMFLTLEIHALLNGKKGDTWSEVVRYLFGFSKRQQDKGWRLYWRQGAFWALSIWFVGHIAFGW